MEPDGTQPRLHLLRALMVGAIVGLCVTLLGPRIGHVQAFGISLLALLVVIGVVALVLAMTGRRRTARHGQGDV